MRRPSDPALRQARELVLAVVVAACGPTGAATAPAEASGMAVPQALANLPVASVSIGPLTLTLAVADSATERTRGLAGIRDLGDLDGLLFAFQSDVETTFTMRGAVIPLDMAFIGADGVVMSVTRMDLCAAEPCPSYSAPDAYRWAIETPAGGLIDVAPGDQFVIRQ